MINIKIRNQKKPPMYAYPAFLLLLLMDMFVTLAI